MPGLKGGEGHDDWREDRALPRADHSGGGYVELQHSPGGLVGVVPKDLLIQTVVNSGTRLTSRSEDGRLANGVASFARLLLSVAVLVSFLSSSIGYLSSPVRCFFSILRYPSPSSHSLSSLSISRVPLVLPTFCRVVQFLRDDIPGKTDQRNELKQTTNLSCHRIDGVFGIEGLLRVSG